MHGASSPLAPSLRDSANLLRQRAAVAGTGSPGSASGGSPSGSRRGSLQSSSSVRGLRVRTGGADGAGGDPVTRAEFRQLLIAVHALTASQEELLSEVRELRSTVMLGMT